MPQGVVQGDASVLPFKSQAFTAAIAVLVLHHLRSSDAQDRAFAEIFRVLKPGGVFVAIEIQDGWLTRVAHFRSTFVPVSTDRLNSRLCAAGFSNVSVNVETRGDSNTRRTHCGELTPKQRWCVDVAIRCA